jgi:hypothetical protein
MISIATFYSDGTSDFRFTDGRHHCENWDFKIGTNQVKSVFIYAGF